MIKFAVSIFAVLSIAMNIGYTQNLVRNPSFEVLTDTCNHDANGQFPFYFLNTIWNIFYSSYPNNNGQPPIIYSECNNSIAGIPHLPRSGKTLSQISYYIETQDFSWDSNVNIGGLLKESLLKDSMYCVGIYMQSFFMSCRTTDKIMMIVAPDSIMIDVVNFGLPASLYTVTDTSLTFYLKKYPHVQLPKNEFITSETEWTPIQGMIKAQGGEKYYYIGNFTSVADLNPISTPWSGYIHFLGLSPPVWAVTMNIDDAFVYARRPVFVKEGKVFELCEEEPFQPFTVHSDQAPEFIWYRAENPAQVLATRDSLYITSPGTYVVKGDACGYISYDTVTVRMKPCNVPPPNELLIPNILTPGADGINDTFVIQNLPPGSSFEFYNRWGNLLYKSENYQNDFTCGNCSGGVYFYVLRTNAGKLYKGQVTIVK